MGWSSGSILMDEIIDAVNVTSLSESEKEFFYWRLIKSFKGFDCDTLSECVDPIFVRALKRRSRPKAK